MAQDFIEVAHIEEAFPHERSVDVHALRRHFRRNADPIIDNSACVVSCGKCGLKHTRYCTNVGGYQVSL